ncbi:hypothetical protein ACIBI3_02330 [Actinomadura luteofluorescens]|uniref:hypothetical protein n=1 Tax=Actinomadura luteofluorescens TaxID=46163 RepID=UPI0034814E83
MTMPVEPATGTPAPATGDASPQQSAAPNTDPSQQPATGSDDWATTFEGMSPAEVKQKLDNSRKWENRAKTNKAKLDQLQNQGQQPAEGEEDWQAKYEAERQRGDEAEARAVELAYETTVNRVAREVGADAEALLDSQAFRDAVAEELDEDFDDDDLKAAITAKAKEFVKKPRFAAQRAGGASGGDFTGSPGAAASIDQQIADAEKRRDFTTAIALKRQRAALR